MKWIAITTIAALLLMPTGSPSIAQDQRQCERMKLILAARLQLRKRELIMENGRLADRLVELRGNRPDLGPWQDTYVMLEKARRAAAAAGTTVEEINRMAETGELGEMVRHYCGPAGASNTPDLN